MSYRDLVRFTKTNRFGCGPIREDDVYTIEEFKEACADGMFVDDDGWGYPVNEDARSDRSIVIRPSTLARIPKDATHIVWYNR